MHTDGEGVSQNLNSGLVRSGLRQRYFVLRFLVGGAIRAVRHALKNCVEVLRGGDACFDEQGLFWRQYLLHVTGLRRISKVTCTGLTGEGPGSQALMIYECDQFCRFVRSYLRTHTVYSD